MTALPPLPPAAFSSVSRGGFLAQDAYTAEQVEQIRRDVVEACARIVDERHDPCEPWMTGDDLRALLEKQDASQQKVYGPCCAKCDGKHACCYFIGKPCLE